MVQGEKTLSLPFVHLGATSYQSAGAAAQPLSLGRGNADPL